ncbi:somatostatin receptor type 2-like [Branchiostoma floridae x Branchiostoma belcheri]
MDQFLPFDNLTYDDKGTYDDNLTYDDNVNGTYVYPYRGIHIIIPCIYAFVCFVGICGNSLVIYVVLRYAKMKTVTNIYIMNLAMADTLFMIGIPFLAASFALRNWPFGTVMCKIVLSLDAINMFSSVFNLTVMSVDRYLAVVHPVKSADFRRPRIAKVVNVCVWVASIIVISPVIVVARPTEEQDGSLACNLNWSDTEEGMTFWSTVFIAYTFVIGFVAPLIIIAVCYTLLLRKVKSASAKAGARGSRKRSRRKVTRMVVVMVVVFVICWLPFYTLQLVNLNVQLPVTPFLIGSYHFIVTLSYANSCVNPILYALLSENFKKSYQKAICHKDASIDAFTTHDASHTRRRVNSRRLPQQNGRTESVRIEMRSLGGNVTRTSLERNGRNRSRAYHADTVRTISNDLAPEKDE